MTLTGPIVPHEWATNAACAKFPTHQTDPIFFPKQKNPDTTDAQNLCATCPARQPCAEYAIESNEPHGIWGGLTTGQREQIRAERKARK
ncbi:MAG TPA: WhiB family transcriptional regulator [Beutenbergiaceae bacterium]|nr:WhiB family transcriptional regulator [Beutenbergiaceae bacterium]